MERPRVRPIRVDSTSKKKEWASNAMVKIATPSSFDRLQYNSTIPIDEID